MKFGVSIFFTEYSIAPAELGPALEERGFESLWAAEHSHIPVARRYDVPTGQLSRQYYDVMDPFVTLAAAAAVTRSLRLATGVCLVIQRDTIQTAKAVASLDRISGGRFIFGIGVGWNAEEMEDHGTVYATRAKKMREQVEAMKEIWTQETAEYHGEFVNFLPMQTRPKPVQKPHPPIIVGGAFPYAARRALRYGDGIIPQAAEAGSGSPEAFMPRWREMARAAGREPLPVTLGDAPEDAGKLARWRELGVARALLRLPPAKREEILPILDRWAELIRRLGT